MKKTGLSTDLLLCCKVIFSVFIRKQIKVEIHFTMMLKHKIWKLLLLCICRHCKTLNKRDKSPPWLISVFGVDNIDEHNKDFILVTWVTLIQPFRFHAANSYKLYIHSL